MIFYRQEDGSGSPYLMVDYSSLQRIIQEETAQFIKDYPQQFENLDDAKEFVPARFTMLANRICLKVKAIKLL